MEFNKCVETRRSIRKYKPIKISHKDFEDIVNLTKLSPSWKNLQIVRFTLIENDNIKNNIAQTCANEFKNNQITLANAPNIIVLSYIKGKSGFNNDGSFVTSKGDRWQMFDAGIAASTLCLAAHSKGFGTVIMGIFNEDKVAKIIKLPENQQIAALIPIGLPDVSPTCPPKNSTQSIITYL